MPIFKGGNTLLKSLKPLRGFCGARFSVNSAQRGWLAPCCFPHVAPGCIRSLPGGSLMGEKGGGGDVWVCVCVVLRISLISQSSQSSVGPKFVCLKSIFFCIIIMFRFAGIQNFWRTPSFNVDSRFLCSSGSGWENSDQWNTLLPSFFSPYLSIRAHGCSLQNDTNTVHKITETHFENLRNTLLFRISVN